MFQMTFAIITPALIIGSFAERTRFSAVMLFSSIWLLVVYAPVTHWVWGGGWLGEMGLLDFAGGTVVHITAGVAALVCALAANGDAGMAMLVTHLSAAAGAFTWLTIEWIKYGKPSALGAVTGMVAGRGTITPASGFVGPAGALVIGISAGTVCFFATNALKQKLKIDDSLDVFPVHGVGGMLGTFAVGIFASSELGIFSGQGLAEGMTIGSQLLVQLCGIAAVAIYTAVATLVILKLVNLFTPLRVSDEEENAGLDIVLHNESGYDL